MKILEWEMQLELRNQINIHYSIFSFIWKLRRVTIYFCLFVFSMRNNLVHFYCHQGWYHLLVPVSSQVWDKLWSRGKFWVFWLAKKRIPTWIYLVGSWKLFRTKISLSRTSGNQWLHLDLGRCPLQPGGNAPSC